MAQGNGWLNGVAGKLGPVSKTPLGPPPVLSDVYAGIIGQSQQLREVLAKIDKVAAGDANVCIMGESGTGKELIARAIHHNSPRRDRPLVTLDCTAVPEGLMESHLFGHRRGSFTGAVEHRNGVFSLADTGTLFIDEISELPLTLQAKLLRVIQSHEFIEVGGSQPIQADIRLITASNKDLREAVADGTFLTCYADQTATSGTVVVLQNELGYLKAALGPRGSLCTAASIASGSGLIQAYSRAPR